MITLLTTTGGRPIPFSLCQRWMEAQDYEGEVRWVIVDDVLPPTPIAFPKPGWSIDIICPSPKWEQGQNTQARNLREGLEAIPKDASVVIIEDDDYYAPTYLSSVVKWLEGAELVGESHARYFNVATDAFRDCGNVEHASLCTTAMRGEALSLFRQVVEDHHKFIDKELWKQFSGPKALHNTSLSCGIKGLPGRGGIGAGHRLKGARDRKRLAKWIGKDARWYGKG